MIRFRYDVVFVCGILSIAAPQGAVAQSGARSAGLAHCLISLIDDIEVPAEKAGILTVLDIREGDYLQKAAAIATIDDVQSQQQVEVTRADAAAAQIKAESLLDEEYAEATYRTADAEFRVAVTANRSLANTVAAVEVEKLRLAAEQARIKIGVSRMERAVRGAEARSYSAKAKMAEDDVSRHRILAPLAGEVVEVFYRRGEWVEPGKPLVRMIRLDRLRVEGFVRFVEHAPADVLHRPVRVTIATAVGVESFTGAVVFVSPLVQPGGEYRIWAEVDNRRQGDQWLLRPGLEAEMTINLTAPDQTAATN